MKKMEKDLVCCCVHLICINVCKLYEIILVRNIETIEKGKGSLFDPKGWYHKDEGKEVYLLALLSHYRWHCRKGGKTKEPQGV
jgi:hypothetical protein